MSRMAVPPAPGGSAWLTVRQGLGSSCGAAAAGGRCANDGEGLQFHPAARSPEVQDALTDYCARLSGIPLPA
jgi:hypothetical protein